MSKDVEAPDFEAKNPRYAGLRGRDMGQGSATPARVVLEWIISQVAWEGAKAVLNRAKLLRKRQPSEEPRRVRVLRANDTVTISATVISQHQDTPPTPR